MQDAGTGERPSKQEAGKGPASGSVARPMAQITLSRPIPRQWFSKAIGATIMTFGEHANMRMRDLEQRVDGVQTMAEGASGDDGAGARRLAEACAASGGNDRWRAMDIAGVAHGDGGCTEGCGGCGARGSAGSRASTPGAGSSVSPALNSRSTTAVGSPRRPRQLGHPGGGFAAAGRGGLGKGEGAERDDVRPRASDGSFGHRLRRRASLRDGSRFGTPLWHERASWCGLPTSRTRRARRQREQLKPARQIHRSFECLVDAGVTAHALERATFEKHMATKCVRYGSQVLCDVNGGTVKFKPGAQVLYSAAELDRSSTRARGSRKPIHSAGPAWRWWPSAPGAWPAPQTVSWRRWKKLDSWRTKSESSSQQSAFQRWTGGAAAATPGLQDT